MAKVIKAIQAERSAEQIESLAKAAEPLLLKGFVSDWPIVKIVGEQGADGGLDYLASFYSGDPVLGFFADAEQNGRIFYQPSYTEYNFSKHKVDLLDHFQQLRNHRESNIPPAFYVGSTATDRWLPGFNEAHPMPTDHLNAVASLWIGNQCLVPAHFDAPHNIACCVIGRRRFTLFPPSQVKNLYVGPIELTPAGQTVSAVDVRHPDYHQFPRYREAEESALIVDMAPGDALFLPSMWWHSVESLDWVNGLVNYWWKNEPSFLGPAAAALTHAMLSIKSLPEPQREAWKALFDYYVFDGNNTKDHLPEEAWGRLGDIDENLARRLRAEILNALK